MSILTPTVCRWTGEVFEPLPHVRKLCDRNYVVGQVYRLVEVHDRSLTSHSHQFAWLHEAWLNLPERLAELFPTAEHLRKRALIDAGFYDETAIDAGTNAAALRVAAYLHGADDFALVIVKGPLVLVRKAKSQSRRAMDKAEFQASKTAVLEVVAAMLGVTPAELNRAEAA